MIFSKRCALILVGLSIVACNKPTPVEKSQATEKVGAFEVVFKKPTGDGLLAQFGDQSLDHATIVRGVSNYKRLTAQKKAFEAAASYKTIKQDFANQSITINFYTEKPQRPFNDILNMLGSEADENFKVQFQGDNEDTGLIAQVQDKKYFVKDLNLNHTAYLQIQKQIQDAVLRKLWESITYMALKQEADQQGMKTKEYLEKNQLMKASEASDEEVRDFLAGINAKLSEINETQFERFRAVVTQKNQDGKIREFIAQNIIKKPITVYLDRPSQVIAVEPLDTAFKGAKDAPIEMQLFTDLLCDNCKTMWSTVQSLQQKFGDQIRLSLYHQHEKSDLFAIFVAEASQCVKDQGENYFWSFVDAVQTADEKVSEPLMNSLVESIGADVEKFKKCAIARNHKSVVAKQNEYALSLGFYRVPNLVINGKVFMGVAPMEDVEPLILKNYTERKELSLLAKLWHKISSIF